MELSGDLIRGAKGAAEYTGLPVKMIYRLAEGGKLPVVRMGPKLLLFRKSELDKAFSAEQAA